MHVLPCEVFLCTAESVKECVRKFILKSMCVLVRMYVCVCLRALAFVCDYDSFVFACKFNCLFFVFVRVCINVCVRVCGVGAW